MSRRIPALATVAVAAIAWTAFAVPRIAHDHSAHSHEADEPTEEPGPCPPGDTVVPADDGTTACVHDYTTHGNVVASEGYVVPFDRPTSARYPVACFNTGHDGRRIQALYVVANDRPNRAAEATPRIQQVAEEADALMQASAAKTGGHRQLRWSTNPDCSVSVITVVIPAHADDDFDTMREAVKAAGHNYPQRRYVMFADSDVFCGLGEWNIDDRPGTDNWHNVDRPLYARVDSSCWAGNVALHEIGHTLGAVQRSAPNTSSGAHCVDVYEIMCGSDTMIDGRNVRHACGRDHRSLLDCNNDDYFHTNPAPGSYLSTRWNVARSYYLLDRPVNPPMPLCEWDSSMFADNPSCAPPMPDGITVTRHAGHNRVATAVAVSQRSHPNGANTVVVVRSDGYADALAAGPFARMHDAPVLLTGRDTVDVATSGELVRLSPSRIYLVGGLSALSSSLESELLGYATDVVRVAGDHRFETAARLAELMPVPDGQRQVAVVASVSGAGWPDAVTASWSGSMYGAPVLLVDGSNVPESTRRALTFLSPDLIVTVGHPAAQAKPTLSAYSPDVWTSYGADRYVTSGEAVVEYEWRNGDPSSGVWVATGQNWPDALVAAPAAAKDDSALYLVPGNGSLGDYTKDKLAERQNTRMTVVGSEVAVSRRVESEVAWALLG